MGLAPLDAPFVDIRAGPADVRPAGDRRQQQPSAAAAEVERGVNLVDGRAGLFESRLDIVRGVLSAVDETGDVDGTHHVEPQLGTRHDQFGMGRQVVGIVLLEPADRPPAVPAIRGGQEGVAGDGDDASQFPPDLPDIHFRSLHDLWERNLSRKRGRNSFRNCDVATGIPPSGGTASLVSTWILYNKGAVPKRTRG